MYKGPNNELHRKVEREGEDEAVSKQMEGMIPVSTYLSVILRIFDAAVRMVMLTCRDTTDLFSTIIFPRIF